MVVFVCVAEISGNVNTNPPSPPVPDTTHTSPAAKGLGAINWDWHCREKFTCTASMILTYTLDESMVGKGKYNKGYDVDVPMLEYEGYKDDYCSVPDGCSLSIRTK